MITLRLSRDPQLLETAVEPTESLAHSINVGPRLAPTETLLSAAVEDYGSGVVTNVGVDGININCDVNGLANGSRSLPVFTALGSLGSVVRFVLLVAATDPAVAVAAVVVAPDHAAATTPHVGVIGLLSGLLTTASGTLVAAVNEIAQAFNDHDKFVLDELITTPTMSWYPAVAPRTLVDGEAYLIFPELLNTGSVANNNIRLNGYSGASDYGVASAATSQLSGAAGAWSDKTGSSRCILYRNSQGYPTAYWMRSNITAGGVINTTFTGGMLNHPELINPGLIQLQNTVPFTGRVRMAIIKHRGL